MSVLKEFQQKSCKPCEGGTKPYSESQIKHFLSFLEGWNCSPDHKSILKTFVMKNFMAAIDLMNKIAKLAESEWHHPDLHLTQYRKLTIELSTHAIGGLSENDFILASKIEELPKELKL